MPGESSFGEILRQARMRMGWTQAELADKLGEQASRVTVNRWEKDLQRPPTYKLQQLVAVLGLNQKDGDALYRASGQAPPKIHNLPFHQNPLFIDRKLPDGRTYLEQIGQFLSEDGSATSTQPVCICGLAGIGKTQLALKYAYRNYPHVYRVVLWVNAADQTTLLRSYEDLTELLKLPEREEREPAQSIQAVKHWLEEHTNWLLIMDNADDLQLARSFFPVVHQGHILLTTRSQVVGNIGRKIEIDKMEPDEGQFFLLRRSGILPGNTTLDAVAADERDTALQIVQLLDGHPLALDQAGAYIEDAAASCAEYVKLYREARRFLLATRGSIDEKSEDEYSEHPESVVVTFELCFNRAQAQQPLATDILRFCAFLQPDAIPKELFQYDDSFTHDARAFREGILAFRRYSLLKRTMQNQVIAIQDQTFTMHRLVQAVLIDAMPPELQTQWRERVMQALNAAFPLGEFGNWRQCERLLPHALTCASWKEDEATLQVAVALAELFHRIGYYLNYRGQYAEAEPLLWRALAIYKQHLGAESPYTVGALNALASLYLGIDDGQAETLFRQALALEEKIYGAESYIINGPLRGLAHIYMDRGEYGQAEPFIKRAHEIDEKHFGANNPETATSLKTLAAFYFVQHEYEKAEPLYRQVLSMLEQHLEADDPSFASPLLDLAACLHLPEKYEQKDEIEALYQRALSLLEKQLGATHPTTLAAKRAYVVFLNETGRVEESITLMRQVGLPQSSPDTL